MNAREEATFGVVVFFGIITWLLVVMALVKYVYY